MEERTTKQSERVAPITQDGTTNRELTSTELARAFYVRMTKRADVRELLRRLAAN